MELDKFTNDVIILRRCSQICKENNFSFILRYELRDWIEKLAWDDLARREELAPGILKDLIDEIDKVCTEKDAFSTAQLQDAKDELENNFKNNPGELIKKMRRILSRERTLTETSPDKGSEEDRLMKKYRDDSDNILCDLNQFVDNIDNLSTQMSIFHDGIRSYDSRITSNNNKLLTLQNRSVTQSVLEEANRLEIDNYVACVEVVNHKKNMYDLVHNVWEGIVKLLARTQMVIGHYRQQQKASVCFLGTTPDGAVDTMNKLCDAVGQQLMKVVCVLHKITESVKLLEINGDDTRGKFEQLAKEMDKKLEDHLQKSFLITEQPPNVIKMVRGQSLEMSLTVHLLGGMAYNLNGTPPNVEVRVFREDDISRAMENVEPMEGACSIKGSGRLEYERATRYLQAQLNSVRLHNMQQDKRSGKHDLVTESKYGVVFYTTLPIGPKSYTIKALSLPIILTSQTGQEGAAKGTLMWHAAFSQDVHLKGAPPYQDPAEVHWGSLEKVLIGMFGETGRSLSKEQLNYIAKIIFGGSGVTETDYSNHPIGKERFLKDKVRCSRDFTYWKWLCGAKNLIMHHVGAEWKDNLIYGFIGKVEAERLLVDKAVGTLLVRFREGRVDTNQKANTCARLALAIVVDTGQGTKKVEHVKDFLNKIADYSLVQILRNMVHARSDTPIVTTVYPDRPFDQVLQKYLPDNKEEYSNYGYTQMEWQIFMRVDDQQNMQLWKVKPNEPVPRPSSSLIPVTVNNNMDVT